VMTFVSVRADDSPGELFFFVLPGRSSGEAPLR
jgi:hypothetical protein